MLTTVEIPPDNGDADFFLLRGDGLWFRGEFTVVCNYQYYDEVIEIIHISGKVVYSKDCSRVGRIVYTQSALTAIFLTATLVVSEYDE